MKTNKKGVSLIVLVITIIVMIILASAVIISLSNANIMNRAEDAVNQTNMKTYQTVADLAWSDAYTDKLNDSTVDIEARVLAALADYGVTREKYFIHVSDEGALVLEYTLGNMIVNAEDYGKTVDYEANGVTKWQVFYEDKKNGYVFLIAEDVIEYNSETATAVDNSLYKIFTLGQENSFPFESAYKAPGSAINLLGGFGSYASEAYIDEAGNSYVVGAIGSPTLHLFLSAYNELNGTSHKVIYAPSYTEEYVDYYFSFVREGRCGYYINSAGSTGRWDLTASSPLYNGDYFDLASPAGDNLDPFDGPCGSIFHVSSDATHPMFISREKANVPSSIRPVVCLKSDIPAKPGTTTDFTLTVSGN